MKVINLGSMNLDYVYQVPHFVAAGETLSSTDRQIKLGGKELNQSVALACAGVEVCHAGKIGDGGEQLLDYLQKKGVDTSLVTKCDEMQGHTVIQVAPNGENCILLFGGSNISLTQKDIEVVLTSANRGDYLILQNEMNLLAEVVDQAYEKGMHMILNPSPFNEKIKGVDLNKIDWLLVNEVEAKQMTGYDDVAQAWEFIHAEYPKLSVLFTLGSKGSVSYLVKEESVITAKQDAYRVEAVDTTAAGDTYTGYFVAGLLALEEAEEIQSGLENVMRVASKASALAVMKAGAAESIPMRDEVMR